MDSKQDIEPCGYSKRPLEQSDVTNVLTYTRFANYFVQKNGDATTMTDLLMDTIHKVATIATAAMFLARTDELFKALFPKSAGLTAVGRDAALFKVSDTSRLLLPVNPFTNDKEESFKTYYTDSFLSLAVNSGDHAPDFAVASLQNFFTFARKVRAQDFSLAQWPLLMNELKKQYQSKGDFPGSEPTVETVKVEDDFVLPQVQDQLQAVEFPNTAYKTITTQIMKGIDSTDIQARM